MGACGCGKRCTTTANLSEEEALLLPFEESLGFGKHTVMDLVKGLFEVTVNGEITEARFRSFLEKFAVAKNGHYVPSGPLGRLFGSFRGSSGYLPARLGLLAALLGGGQDQPRGEAVFLCCDLDHAEFLPLKKVTELLTLLADIALFRLPMYAAECLTSKGENKFALILHSYTRTLARSKEDAVAALVSHLMDNKDNVSALKFSSAFTHFARWLRSASAMRAFARDPSQKLEAKKEGTRELRSSTLPQVAPLSLLLLLRETEQLACSRQLCRELATMGNVCCNSRPTKLAVEKPRPKPRLKNVLRQRRSVQLPNTHRRAEKHEHEDNLSGQSTAPLNTTIESWQPQGESYHSLEIKLPPLANLPEDTKDHLRDVIDASTKDFGQAEEVVGYINAATDGGSQRLLVLTSAWLYMLDAETLRIYRKVRLSSIQLVTLSPDRDVALLHTGGAELEGDLLFTSSQAKDFIDALEVVTHSSLQHYIPVTTGESEDAVRKKLNAVSKATLLSYHTAEFQELTRVFVTFGEVGENRLYFRRTRVCSQQLPEIKCQVLLSTHALYILGEDFSLLEKVALEVITAVTVSNTSDKVVVHSAQGDRMFFLNNSLVEALDKAMGIRKLERLQVCRKSNLELDIVYCRSREALSAMPET